MTVTQLIYASQPFGFDEAGLRQILLAADRNNTRDGITGSLICRDDVFLQLLEGPEDKVEAAFNRIGKDDRHIEVNRLVSRPAQARLFGDWAMRHDPVRAWMWTRQDIADGALDTATPDSVIDIFERLSRDDDA